MTKKRFATLSISLLLVVTFITVLLLILSENHRDAQTPANDEATIDQAIKEKNPELCNKVTQTTRPNEVDGAVVVKGTEAVKFCKLQVEQGSRIIGG